MSVKVIVPARFTPLGDSTLVKSTTTVQDAPGAKFVPVQLSAPPKSALSEKNQVNSPLPAEVIETPVTATDDALAAGLVSVTVPVPEKVPAANVIVSGFGEIVTVPRVATPVPLNATGEPVTVAPV